MKYFTKTKNDLEGYRKNIKSLEQILDNETYLFMLNHSFHDSLLTELTVLDNSNEDDSYDSKISPVSVRAQVTYWDDTHYELLWEEAHAYSVDFDVTRNTIVETGLILYERGLDQWSHDELVLTAKGLLHHQIVLFSQTKISITCKKFSIRHLG